MKKLIGTIAATACAVAIAETTITNAPTFETILRARYERDIRTESGRVAWHGKLEAQAVDTNRLERTTTYADGTRFVDPYVPVNPLRVVQNANRRLPKVAMTNGIPVRLANARRRRIEAENVVSNVTINVRAGE